jgi:UDP-glucose 4-epimerase
MTRFMMSLDDAVELVMYAFIHGQNGDMFVQKAPAATIETLAQSMVRTLGVPNHPINIIGTRHGEKLYETLLSREEMTSAVDLGDYYRVLPDLRDLNYAKYVERGETRISEISDYSSHNTRRLDVAEMSEMLGRLDYIQDVVKGYGAVA